MVKGKNYIKGGRKPGESTRIWLPQKPNIFCILCLSSFSVSCCSHNFVITASSSVSSILNFTCYELCYNCVVAHLWLHSDWNRCGFWGEQCSGAYLFVIAQGADEFREDSSMLWQKKPLKQQWGQRKNNIALSAGAICLIYTFYTFICLCIHFIMSLYSFTCGRKHSRSWISQQSCQAAELSLLCHFMEVWRLLVNALNKSYLSERTW